MFINICPFYFNANFKDTIAMRRPCYMWEQISPHRKIHLKLYMHYICCVTNCVWLTKGKRQVSYNSVAFWWKNYSLTGVRAARTLLKKDVPLSIIHSGGGCGCFLP